uniref:Uncharacterized protein n=1 Tax=Rhizophora mucronata TaxID=61149 RepID=A0A2P2QRN1_RHIMU
MDNGFSLDIMAVIDCPKLKNLPINHINIVNSTSMLLTVNGYKEWWDGLEWG